MILRQNRNSSLRIIESHVVNLQKVAIGLSIQLALPKVYPLIDRIPRFLGVEGLLSYADQLEGRNMEHLLEGSGVVSSFDDLQRNTVADFKHRGTYFRRQGLIFFR